MTGAAPGASASDDSELLERLGAVLVVRRCGGSGFLGGDHGCNRHLANFDDLEHPTSAHVRSVHRCSVGIGRASPNFIPRTSHSGMVIKAACPPAEFVWHM